MANFKVIAKLGYPVRVDWRWGETIMARRRGRPKTAETIHDTDLSRFVRDYRENVLGLNQDQFLDRLGLKGIYLKQYQSKVENARLIVPADEYLKQLGLISGKSFDELKQMASGPAPADMAANLRFDLCFGHDFRGAPLFLAIQDVRTGLHEKFRIASTDDAPEPKRSPRWFDPFRSDRYIASDVRTYSAGDVIDDLQKHRILVGAFPGNLVYETEGLGAELQVVCSIVDSTGPLNFVVNPHSPLGKLLVDPERSPIRESLEGDRTLDTNDLGRSILYLLKESGSANFKIAIETKTVGERALEDACEYAQEVRKQTRSGHVDKARLGHIDEITAGRFGCDSRNSRLLNEDFTQLAESLGDCDLIGVITWWPHASILSSLVKSRGEGDCPSFILNRAAAATGRPRHMSYDIVVHRESLSDQHNPRVVEFRSALDELIDAVAIKADYLRDRVKGGEVPGPEVLAISRYFGIDDPAQVALAIGTILFNVRLTVRGHRALEG